MPSFPAKFDRLAGLDGESRTALWLGRIAFTFLAVMVAAVGASRLGVVAVAPPLAMGELVAPRLPTLVLAGDRDAYCPPAALQTFAAALSAGGAAQTIAGADHFLAGHEAAIGAAARDFLAEVVGR